MGIMKELAEERPRFREIESVIQSPGETLSPGLKRVQERAKNHPETKFMSLAHHLTVENLYRAYQKLNKDSAPGIDGVTYEEYGQNLQSNLRNLHRRLKDNQYRAKPVKRVYIDKNDGGKRPLGIPTTEDKIVQSAVVEILTLIYEEEFHGCSYGFRPGKGAHKALQALQTALQKGKVNWVLDTDIKGFFDNIDHKKLMQVLSDKIVDSRLLRIIGKWLAAGSVEEDGSRSRSKKGTPQGGIISPVLANIFLHKVVDDFVVEWRKAESEGEVYIVRYADDFVIAMESRVDVDKLLRHLKNRVAEYGLQLHPDKTKIVKFGKEWIDDDDGDGPGTFEFLGFTHITGRNRTGDWYLVKRRTMRTRLRKAIKSIYQQMKKMMHKPLAYQCKKLSQKLQGHYGYYGIRGNFKSLQSIYYTTVLNWWKILGRRSQMRLSKLEFYRILKRFPLPKPRIVHNDGWLDVNPGSLL